MKDIINKMIDHPISTIIVASVVVNGVSVLVYNIGTIIRSK